MRIAWFGPVGEGAGGPGLGARLLEAVLARGATVDLYATSSRDELPAALRASPGLHVVQCKSRWQWNRWYSRKPFVAFISGTIARKRVHHRMARSLVERHRSQPYDCIFQFSQSELFEIGRQLHELPPVVIHPCSHSAGELRWHRRESAYALKSERRAMHFAARLMLMFRAAVQKRELRKPALIIGPSRRFNQLLSQDYGIEAQRLAVLRHPISMPDQSGAGASPSSHGTGQPLTLLFVSRISVRKGVEQVVELSRRLDDLAGQVRIDVIGGATQWSDYRAHLRDLNPRVARYVGQVRHQEMARHYAGAAGLLVPSMYEPGSLVVGEALTHGLAVVASDEVGPVETLSAEVCRTFPAGNVDALEAQTRRVIDDIRQNGPAIRSRAREEACAHASPEKIGGELLSLLQRAIDRRLAAQGSPAVLKCDGDPVVAAASA